MIIKNVSAKKLQYLNHWENDLWHANDYNIVGRHLVKKTITRPLPFYSYGVCEGGYLEGYSRYYEPTEWLSGMKHLKREYRGENRPTYTLEISYCLLDIELTERGFEKVMKRYEQHMRIAKRYASLLPTND